MIRSGVAIISAGRYDTCGVTLDSAA